MRNFSSPVRGAALAGRPASLTRWLLLAVLLAWASRGAAQTITSFAPTTGAAGTSVTFLGTGLDAVTGVRFGTGTLTTNFVSQSATSLTVRVPVVSSTGLITLTSNLGSSVSSATAFTYTPGQNLTATLSPAGPLDVCQPRTLTASASSPAFAIGTGFDNQVQSVVVQTDGKVLAGGNFTTYQGTTANYLIRLNADRSRDATFDTGTGFDNAVRSMAVQADGKVLVGAASRPIRARRPRTSCASTPTAVPTRPSIPARASITM